MDRSNEHSRPARFTWSRSAFANSASRVSDVSQQGAWAGAGGANAAREDPHHDSAWSRRPATTSQVVTTLAMDPEKGAQLEVEFVQGCGYRVESIGKEPGQPLMRVGDLLVEVNGKSLASTSEDEADEVLAAELRDGVTLLLERASEEKDPAPDEAEVPLSRMVPETPLGAAKLQEDAAPRPLAGLLSSLFSFAPPEEPQAPAGEQPTAGPELPQEEQPLHDETLPSWPEETPEVVTAVTSMTEERPDEAIEKEDGEDEEVIVFESMLPAEKIKDDLDRPQETEPSGLAELEAAKLDDAGAVESEDGGEVEEVKSLRDLAVPSNADEAPTGTAESSEAALAIPTVRCKVADLGEWLQELRLEEYLDPAAKWCSEMGAVCLEEIAENIEDFAADVALKPIERQRVQKWAAQKLQGIAPMQRLREAELQPLSRKTSQPDRRSSQRGLGLWTPPEPDAPRDARALWAEEPREAAAPVYTARSVRLAVDAQGNTGLDLRFDDDWGIRVQSVDPLPGQLGLAEGDFIVAIDGCSLRHKSHEDCDQAFSERLQNGAILSVVRPTVSTVSAGPSGYSCKNESVVPNWRLPRPDFRNGPSWSRQRRGGHDANRMWNRFNRGPPW
ncbi:unnamed protein product [Durusdinium trenchii]|uniref:PDZ domain-containing protein n=1 Tax=Durusdinium trenchii TaxID=1381693 RepID=A0ABP0PSU1_9DINO